MATTGIWHGRATGDPGSPAVVLLHGFLGSAGDWDEVAARLGQRFHCLAFDLPGHGGTTAAEGCPMQDVAASLLSHLDSAGVTTAAVAGYSMGGRLALYLALHAPDRFGPVVIESASPGLEDGGAQAQRRIHDEELALRLEALAGDGAGFRAFLEEWYTMPIFSGLGDDAERLEGLVSMRLKNDPKRLAKALRGLSTGRQPSLWDALETHTTPTLLIVGEKDRKYRILAERMCERAPKMAVETFAGCGHNVHFENPGGYTTALEAFLGSLV